MIRFRFVRNPCPLPFAWVLRCRPLSTPSCAVDDPRRGEVRPGPRTPASIRSSLPTWESAVAITRIRSPLPSLLLMWPCFWSAGMACAPGSVPSLVLLSKFATGAILMRSAGCVINDMLDYRIDARVDRTKQRPLAAGTITMEQATVLLAALLSSSLGILLTFDSYTIALGSSSVLIVCAYPMMKRCMDWPQLVLGLAFNFGAILGWAAVQGPCDWSVVLPLYGCGICWTIVYDTIYAHQDKADDERVGVRSTALLFGEQHRKAYLSGFAAGSLVLLAASGYAAGMHSVFYASAAGAALHMAQQIHRVDLDDRRSCFATFLSNSYLGGVIALGVFLDRALY